MALYPEISVPKIIRDNRSNTLKYGRAPLFDFETGEFIMSPEGAIEEANDQKVLIQHVKIALSVERGAYPIFNFNFGNDLNKLIGQTPSFAHARAPSMIREALMLDPRIEGVDVQDVDVTSQAYIEADIVVRDAVSRQEINLGIIVNGGVA